jgi:hypothetical protein
MRIRIRIQQLKLMRIHADPDPVTDLKPCLQKGVKIKFQRMNLPVFRIRIGSVLGPDMNRSVDPDWKYDSRQAKINHKK